MRTEAKREAILQAASEVFLELGYERASMSEITARAGGSKATLYGYFSSKEDLFLTVAEAAANQHLSEAALELSKVPEDLEATLRGFGEKLLTFMGSSSAIAIHRMVIAESGHSDIGAMFFKAGPLRGITVISHFLEAAMKRGELRQSDPKTAAFQFLALVNAEHQHRWFFKEPPAITRKQIQQSVLNAVRTFISGYAIGAADVPASGARKARQLR